MEQYIGFAESVPGGDAVWVMRSRDRESSARKTGKNAVWVMRSRDRESSARKTGKIGQNLCITICDRVQKS